MWVCVSALGSPLAAFHSLQCFGNLGFIASLSKPFQHPLFTADISLGLAPPSTQAGFQIIRSLRLFTVEAGFVRFQYQAPNKRFATYTVQLKFYFVIVGFRDVFCTGNDLEGQHIGPLFTAFH